MTTRELATEFMKNYAERKLRPSTVRGYRTNFNRHILPKLGDVEITTIKAGTLDQLNISMTIGNKSKIYVHATFRKALNYAIKREYIRQNPYSQFDMPKAEDYQYRVLNETEIEKMLLCSTGTELEVPIKLALCYGLRRGECLGIRTNSDLDPVNHVLHVQRTRSTENGAETVTPCKTKKSNRYILITVKDVELLKKKTGQYACGLSPAKLDKLFQDFLEVHHLPKIRFHDLRHSYATFMLSKGINPKIVSTILGHSRIDTTLDIYSHPDVGMQVVCLNAMKK